MNLRKLEGRLQKYNRSSDALALSIVYWLKSILGGEPDCLEKSDRALADALSANPVCPQLLLMSIFVDIVSDNFNSAAKKLDQALKYRSYFKLTNPLYYGIVVYLEALLQMRRDGGLRSEKRSRKQLSAIKNEHPALLLVSAMYLMEMGDRKGAYADLAESYKRGCASPFLYAALWELYRDGADPQDPLAYPFLVWALEHDADLRPISRFTDCIRTDFFANESAAKLLSQKYSHPDLHRKNCVYRMEARDFSRSAYDIYKAAEDRQVPVPSLPEFLIRAAWKNGFENVSRATMEKYLSSVDVRSDREIGLIAFVYHLILTDPKLEDFIEERQYDILQFGMYSLENGLKGRYFNSIYHFFAKVGGNAVGAEDGHMRQAREILKEAMFLHEVRFETPGSMFTHLYVSEKDRRELGYYSVNNGVAYVRAVDKDFACYCMAAGGQGISGETPYVTPMLENPDKDLLWGFFDDGERMFPLLMSLGRDILAANSETPAAKAIPLLAALLESGELSFSMQNTVNAALGGILHGDGKPERALQYYAKVDENLLDDRYIERMLTVFTGMEQWEKAGRLVMKKAHAVSDRALFRAVRKIAQSAAAQAQRPMIVNAAYELLLKNWYDKKLLELVIGSYPGSQEEWQELSRVLAAMSVTEIGLDEKILENSLWMHKLDAGSQKAFVRMAQNSPENPLTERYAYYCVYEMIANKAKPSYETLLILEKMYDKNKDEILAIGLAHAYLLHDALTFRTEAILAAAIEAQEKMGVLFPIFAGRRDKTGVSAYIEKNRAFLYKGLPGKDMRLYYKAGDDADFRWKRMKYFRFGIYLCAVPQFYGEEIVYYYSETHPTGSISTKEETVRDTGVYINEDSEDPYFTINNALIYEQMFKYDEAEKMAELVVKDGRDVNARII